MSARLAKLLRHPFRLLGSAALLALAPKCGCCLLAYAGLGAALGLRVPEICGAAAGPPIARALLLAVSGVALGLAGRSALLGRRVTAAGQGPEAQAHGSLFIGAAPRPPCACIAGPAG